MAKKFAGFTQQQTELLARKMGFDGPMDQFQNFVKSDPGLQSKFASYESKAKSMVEGAKEKRGFATGGLATATQQPTQQSAMDLVEKVSIPVTGVNEKGKEITTSTSAMVPTQNSQGSQVTQEMLTNPETYVSEAQTHLIKDGDKYKVNESSGQYQGTPDAQATQAKPIDQSALGATDVQAQQASTPDKVEVKEGLVSTAEDTEVKQAPQVDAQLSQQAVQDALNDFGAIKGTVSPQALVEAVTANPSVNATVAGQLSNLMGQFENGNIPAWAAGAVRNVNSIMGKRGLGSSSIAASATTQAAMESALQIAIQDANTYSQFEMQNLNNRQQAALQNAQSFLQMDLANMNNEQQMAVSKMQMITSSILSDQAAVNAASQFNATSQMQTDQFFAQMKAQISQFNAAQSNAMEQFNIGNELTASQVNAQLKSQTDQFNVSQANSVALDNASRTDSMKQFTASLDSSTDQFNASQKNAMEQFNRQVNEQREQFNAANRLIIDQSNAEWRRQVITTNKAELNETARLTAQMETAMTTAAYNNMMQKERDTYSFLYQSSENALQRAAELVMAKYNYSASRSSDMSNALGSLAGSAITKVFQL